MRIGINLFVVMLASGYMFLEWLVLSLILLGLWSASLVILNKNPVYSVFYLILTFCISSMLLLTLLCDFIAIVFVIVYVGAIAVLFLFVVMMLNIKYSIFTESILRFIPFIILLVLLLISELYFSTLNFNLLLRNMNDFIFNVYCDENIVLLGELLYTEYTYMFILSGVILLLAMIGTISITLYHSNNVKRQVIFKQVGRTVLCSIVLRK